MRAARGLCAGTAALIVLATGAGFAQAEDLGTSGGITYIRESQGMVPNGDEVSLLPACPASTNLTGGGFDPVDGSPFGAINSAAPLDDGDADEDPDDGWAAHMVNASNDPAFAEAFVMCTTGRSVVRTSKPRTAKPDKSASAKVACPKSKWLTGGGVFAEGPIGAGWLSGSIGYDGRDRGGAPDGWRGRFFNTSDNPHQVRAYAVCRDIDKPRYKLVTDSVPAGFASSRTVTADGAVMGVGTSRASKWPITQAQPTDSADDADSIPDNGGSFAARNPTERELKWQMLTIHAR